MHVFNKIWHFLVNCGLALFSLTIMLVGAISLFSLTNRGTVYYGNRCISSIDDKALKYLNQDEIIAYDYELQCNTLYLDLVVDDEITKDESISLLVRIANYYNSIEYNTKAQVTLKNSSYLILASLIGDGTVSLSVSEI